MAAASHVPTLRAKSPRFVPSASNDEGSGTIRLSFRSRYLDATGQTMSDHSDSHFIQRPSSTLGRRSLHLEIEAFLRLRPKGCSDGGEDTPIAVSCRTIIYYARACRSG